MADPCKIPEIDRCAALDGADFTHLGVECVIINELKGLRPEFEWPNNISVHPGYFPFNEKPNEQSERPAENVSRDFARQLFDLQLSALCLSGGGIRSASFCLGVLQELAERKLLADFDYISTVSGGGYIGSWLSAWRKHREDAERVRHRLIHEAEECVKTAKSKEFIAECFKCAATKATAANRSDVKRSLEAAGSRISLCADLEAVRKDALFHLEALMKGGAEEDILQVADSAEKCDGDKESIRMIEPKLSGSGGQPRPTVRMREAPEVERLRNYTSYLTPRRGFMSLDSWASAATIIRNLLLNWLIFLPAFLLFVAAPKALLELFAHIRLCLGPEAPVSLQWGSRACYLLGFAALFYAVSEVFTSIQLIHAQRQGQTPSPPPFSDGRKGNGRSKLGGFGAGNARVALVCLPLTFASAYLVSAVLACTKTPNGVWEIFGWITFALALLWTISFSLALAYLCARGCRFDLRWGWLLFARLVGGAGVGASLALVFGLLSPLYATGNNPEIDADILLILGISGAFLAHLVGNVLFSGVTSIGWDRVDRDAVREWMARAGGLFMAALLGSAIYGSLVLLPWFCWLNEIPPEWWPQTIKTLLASVGGAAGLAAAFFGFSPASGRGAGLGRDSLDSVKWMRVAVAGAFLFFSMLVIVLSQAFDWVGPAVQRWTGMPDTSSLTPSGWVAVLALLAIWTYLASITINVNIFSLHAYYRNRLVRAYLGTSNNDRWPSSFTGFDDGDNVKMHDLECSKPLHVINVSLNLAAGSNLAWQERKASSFTITPLSVGNPHLGYRPPKEYASGLTLGTAMAVSGAAVSPNMGYNSSPPLAFLMTLFNLRLGWWLGNPAHDKAWRKPGPQCALWYLAMELFGLTNDETRFVYLSDGGHFENLGVYEMLRRRCRTIVVVDAGEDPHFQFRDLGSAIRKARVDFGVEIEFPESETAAGGEILGLGLNNWPKTRGHWPYCAVADIKYREQADDSENWGALIYIKPAIHGDEPQDIWSYATVHQSFPHEATLDQFFEESQFESYRRLGRYIGGKVFDLHGNRQKRFRHAYDLEMRAREHIERATRGKAADCKSNI